jgi:7-carboxy-7-deazaguanine synthase
VKVSEIFGPTVQGEGPSTGRRAGFVRLGRCDLACKWCDTPYTWDWTGRNGTAYRPSEELRDMTVEEVVGELEAMCVGLVVITGGEPFVQPAALTSLVVHLAGEGFEIEVETNGRHAPNPVVLDKVTAFNVSPKLPNSGQSLATTWRPSALGVFRDSGKARFKFVCCTAADVELVAQLTTGLGIRAGNVWVMPEGQTARALRGHLAAIAGAAIAYGFNVTGRLHIDIWGGVRAH